LPRQFRLLKQRDQIERSGEHRKFAVCRAWPLLARPVPVELDAVVIGIAQIERFAYAVIGALERNVGCDQTSQRSASAPRVG
jgi:hypothetical protein